MSDWIFQANPKHYDVVGALRALDEIAWRVPQHTGSVQPGDHVYIWRSGNDAGIVGVGTVASPPQLLPIPGSETPYVLDDAVEGAEETRVMLRVAPVTPISKADLANLPEIAAHQICTAPMGTVFPLSDRESEVLRRRVSAGFPAVSEREVDGFVSSSVFSWKDRRKDVYPMPGGYDEQVESLRSLIQIVAERRPTMDEFASLVQEQFKSSPSNARHIGLFLRRTGFIDEVSGLLQPSRVGAELLQHRDDDLVLVHLHQRIRFIGEFLHSVQDPLTATEVLGVANQSYGMGWTTKAQIQRRRGWLQSVGAIQVDDEGRIGLTDSGRAALAQLKLHLPDEPPEDGGSLALTDPENAPPIVSDDRSRIAPSAVDGLVKELIDSSTDSGNPDRFEHAVAKAFEFLGFRAVKVGGAGKTDVVADADLGRDDSYRVIIDGKTTSRDAVGDQQIDWDTIEEHRKQHEANYVVIAGPAFGGPRVVNRASGHDATLMTANDLEELIRQHASMPLDLDTYRELFKAGPGEVDLERLTESVEASQRFLEIAVECLAHVEANVSEVGPLSARDLHLLMRTNLDLEASEPEIQAALEALASPLVGALTAVVHPGGVVQSYRPSTNRVNSVRRLRLLADAFETPTRPTLSID